MKRSTVVIALAMAPIALFVSIGVAFGTPGSNAVSVYPLVARSVARPSRSYWGRRRPSLSRAPSE